MTTALSQRPTKTRKSGLYIGVTCTGCGADLQLGDDLFVIICPHCGSHLRLLMPDLPAAYMVQPKVGRREVRFAIDRYLKEHNQPLTGSQLEYRELMYPYWKMDGVVLRIRNKIEQRSVGGNAYDYENADSDFEYDIRKTEVSLAPHSVTVPAGAEMPAVPSAIGIRSQYIPMVAFARDKIPPDYAVAGVIQTPDSALESVARTVDHMGKAYVGDFGQNRSELLSCNSVLVQFPFVHVTSAEGSYERQFVVDSVSARVHRYSDCGEYTLPERLDSDDSVTFGEVKIVAHRCDNCGADLPRGRSFLYICNNCHRLNVIDKTPLPIQRIEIARDRPDNHPLFPFWVFELNEGDAADVTRLFGGLRQVQCLTVPAFKLSSFEALYRLTQRVSAALPSFPVNEASEHDDDFRPVTLSPSDAALMGKVMMYRALVGRAPETTIKNVSFNPTAARLVFLPFHEESYFYVDSVHNAVTFEKNLV